MIHEAHQAVCTLLTPPLVVSYGAGVDSTAMLVGLWARGIRPDLILFADPGEEWPETYAYLFTMQAWLESVGFPSITVVRRVPPKATYRTLGEAYIQNKTLPSPAYGGKSCSVEWKAKPQHRFLKTWAPAIACWAQGRKVQRMIGFDDSASDRGRAGRVQIAIGLDDSAGDHRRATRARSTYAGGGLEAELFDYAYPLQEWGWDRAACVRVIEAVGLPVPRKSSCTFCPSMKKHEIVDLAQTHPDLFARNLAIEAGYLEGKHGPAARAAQGKQTSTVGLGRRFAWADCPSDPAAAAAWAAPKPRGRRGRKAAAVAA